jgi:adenosylcobinamide-phosphate synthase
MGIAAALDLTLGELPNRYHPVAWFGRGIGYAERRLPQATEKQRWRSGLALTGMFGGEAVIIGLVAPRVVRWFPGPLSILAEALLLKQAFAIRALFEHTKTVERHLRTGDIETARWAAGRMVSRDTAGLPAVGLASAAIESLAENTSDSIVAPILWYALLGLPAAFAYRAANTLDAIVGYPGKESFGTPSARLDDLLNLAPARLTGALIVAASSGRLRTYTGMLRDAQKTPSPNAGWPMAAAAHALGIRLEKRGHHVLNEPGRLPCAEDIAAARMLMSRALVVGAGLVISSVVVSGRRR